jgi:carboxypeptidase PM20D1
VAAAPAPPRAVDAAAVAARLAAALRFATISHDDPTRLPRDAFAGLQQWLAHAYPRLHAALERERVSEWSLLYTWRGRDARLEPLLLLAHQDVVPAEQAERWSHPPFAGVLADDFVWGRGAMDDKGSLVAICEAVEALLAEGFEPGRSVLLAFGHDEEVGGGAGAARIAERLAARGVRAHLVLDEGMAVLADSTVPGLERPLAPIGIAEKGYATLELVASAAGGHSSTPPRHTAAGILARAIERLEAHPLPARVAGPTEALFAWLAPELPLWARVPLANARLLVPLDAWMSREPAANALLRTTTAVTMLSGSPKDNVLPVEATAVVNFRILPGETSAELLERVRAIVADARVELRFREPPREPSPVSPVDGPAFAVLQRTIAETIPGAVVAPNLVLGGTDARRYAVLTPNVYRFGPFVYGTRDLERVHGIDERLSIRNLAEAVRFYARLVENAAGPRALP